MIWALREYDEVDPIILSVSEEDEVSIEYVASLIKKIVGHEGEMVVILILSFIV